MRRIAVIAISFLLLIACKKNDNNQPPSVYEFQNTISQGITIKLFSNSENVTSNKPYKVLHVDANERTTANASDILQSSYIEWYSDDFLVTNWSNEQGFAISSAEMVLPAKGWSNEYSKKDKRLERKIWLKGDGTQTLWVNINNSAESILLKRNFTITRHFSDGHEETYTTKCFNSINKNYPVLDIQYYYNSLAKGMIYSYNGSYAPFSDTLYLSENNTTKAFILN